MVLDFSKYLQPGTYVDAADTPSIVPVGAVPTVLCLIGRGVGYHTHSETVTLTTAGGPATLTKKGINPASIKVSGYITDPNAAGQSIPYTFKVDQPGPPVVPEDYSVATDTTPGATLSVTTITKSTGSDIEELYPQVTVSYQYTDADYYALNYFEDFASIVDTYGAALDPITGDMVSPLSFGAQVAMQNGATRLFTVALNPASGTITQQFAAAYQLLSGANISANVVVPLWDTVTDGAALTGMLQTLNAALLADALNGILRMAFVGFDSGYTGSPANVATLAQGISSKRIVMAWPNKLQYYNTVLNTTVDVDGIYLAAAYAGVLTQQDVQMPLTHKYVRGFAGFPLDVQRALTASAKDTLGANGVTVTDQDRAERMRIRHGLTTDVDGGILTKEISLVRSQDALYNLMQDTMESSGLIGQPITPDTALQVKSIVSGALETATTVGMIYDYNSLVVREQSPPSGDPTVIEVRFAYKPSWPLNYIVVNFTVDTTTGDTELVNTAVSGTEAAAV